MGTRNSTIVTLDGEIKVAQYGQWDGYPTGQGQTIANFFNREDFDLEKFKDQVNKVREITQDEIDKVNNTPNWKEVYPYLSRDAGADILNMIFDGKVEFVVLDKDFKNDTLFCEYWYDINLDDETVTMNGTKYTFKEWMSNNFMEKLEHNEHEE